MPTKKVEIFVDESGDLGMNRKSSSRHLVVGAVVTTKPEQFRRITKRARKKLGMKGEAVHEFKFKKSSDWIRSFFLNEVNESSSWISWVALDKWNAPAELTSSKKSMYLSTCRELLGKTCPLVQTDELNLTFDRRTEGFLNQTDFDRDVAEIVSARHSGYFPPSLKTRHIDSRNSESLQVADFVLGSIFQKVERDCDRYYRVIESKVRAWSMLR